MKMTVQCVAAGDRGQLAQGLAHQAGLQAHVGVAHLALDLGLGDQGRHRVDDDQVDGAGGHQAVGDLQGLLAVVGLRDQQVLDLHAQLAGVDDVQGVFGVDERAHAAGALGLGDGLQGEGGLARRLGAVDLDHPAAGQAAHAQGQVQADRAGGDDRRSRWASSLPSAMMAPLPNCFSMAATAAATAFIFSLNVDMSISSDWCSPLTPQLERLSVRQGTASGMPTHGGGVSAETSAPRCSRRPSVG